MSAGDGGPGTPRLSRDLGLAALTATGVCAMLGAGINIVPFMIQRNVPGIGPHVPTAFLAAALPAVLAALAYAALSSAMPRAGGSYVFASRGLNPYLGFVASFSQWFGLSVVMGVVAYVLIPFVRDVAAELGPGGETVAELLERGWIRVGLALAFLWGSVALNLRGLKIYSGVLVPMMIVMFVLGGIVIVAGFSFDHADFADALLAAEGVPVPAGSAAGIGIGGWLAATAILFASFIGFDAIAQAGGEARDPRRSLPRAIGLAVAAVGAFYLLFTAAVYHAVPWQFIAERAQNTDLTAPGLLGYHLDPVWTVLIVAGAAIALVNDLPAMLLAVSRLCFAWAADGVFPAAVAKVSSGGRAPHVAIVLSAGVASLSVIGCHLAGDFFLGVDILVTSMLVNFALICATALVIPCRNPSLARGMKLLGTPRTRYAAAGLGLILLLVLLGVHTWRDLAGADPWYLGSTLLWIWVMLGASIIYLVHRLTMRRRGFDPDRVFAELPE